MKLLITTQKVDKNDDVLGFFHSWIAEFAKHCQKLTVICLQKGEYDLPSNVKVLSLGKEKYINSPNFSFVTFSPRGCWGAFIRRFALLLKFYQYIWRERKNYEAIFVHMNPEYVVLGGLFWKLWQKKIALWYAHGHIPWQLRVAEKFTDIIFTSTASGCRLKSQKIKVVGQGIDVEKFKVQSSKLKVNKNKFKIITIGRISPIKDYETLIKAVGIFKNKLKESQSKIEFDIIGAPATNKDKQYENKIKGIIKRDKLEDVVRLRGAVPNKEIEQYLETADLFISASQTGSLDKAILEAMASGVPVLVCNEALVSVLNNYAPKLMYTAGNYQELAEKINFIYKQTLKQRIELGIKLREIVENNHSLEGLIRKIVSNL